MGKSNCAVIGCANSSYRLVKWKKSLCETHKHQQHEACGCPEPFCLYCFPGPKRYKEQRDRWIKAVKREKKGKKSWSPCNSDRVCSAHFIDGIPTAANSDPVLEMGYTKPQEPRPRKKVERKPFVEKGKNQVALNLKRKPSLQKLQSKKTRKL
eukprot:gene6577-12113_t